MSNFTLQVAVLPVHLRELRILLALEQYYMLTLNPQNNTLLVAGGSPGGLATAETNRELLREPVYMYQQSILIYVFSAIRTGPNSLNDVLGIRQATGFLDSDELLYNTFFLSRTPLDHQVEGSMSVTEVQELFKTVKNNSTLAKLHQGPSGAKTVQLTRIKDNQVFTFPSVSKASN